MKKYPYVKCLNPQKILNPYTKETVIVGCGKCEACRMQKASQNTLRCKLESMSHKYTYFITLTFNQDFIPRMVPVYNESKDILEKHHFTFCDKSTGEVLNDVYLSLEELDKLRKKVNLEGDFPYLSKREAQLFIKRLRKHISKFSDEKIRYYIVGEYGPVHFRPHYHLELWFSDDEIAKRLGETLHKVWPFGRFDFQKSQGKSASYVAGYLNSSCNLPKIYSTGKPKAFQAHSFFLGQSVLAAAKEEVYAMPASDFVRRCMCIDGVNSEFTLWSSFISLYFPRCPQYSLLTEHERVTSYRTYAESSCLFGKISPFQQAKTIVDSIVTDLICIKKYPIIQYFANKYNITKWICKDSTDYERKIRSVYLELKISKHFIDFVCDGRFDISGIRLIDKFYKDLDYSRLVNQIETERCMFLEGYDIDDIQFLYHNLSYDSEEFKDNKLFRQYREQTLTRASNSVKHKELNDKNKIFLY